ncbi:BMP family ABC transporter substrate-binding protein [Brevibacterium album]|uniref:BMP family ABC transporter substrate-binding protein n=1 Tax=Brevibacterium album TaxID=417948 RepID=UPI00040BA13E|nr:BMP family ABC transporter substrate-binding protein [Brevibacterium album]
MRRLPDRTGARAGARLGARIGTRASALVLTGVLAGVLAACGSTGPGEREDLVRTSVCAVSAPAGFSDFSVGQEVFSQIRTAVGEGVVDSTSSQRVSTAAQTRAALERYTADACTLTVAVGPGGGEALAEVAGAASSQAFLAVGAAGEAQLPENVLTIDFDLAEPAYLAGFAAASATESGTVAVSVSQGFPDGGEVLEAFDAGAREYASQHGEEIVVLGEGSAAERTLSDTAEAGADWARGASEAGADVLAPFGSAAPQGVLEHLEGLAAEAAEAGTGGEAPAEGEEAGSAGEEAGTGEGPEEEADAEASLPSLIWYGADGAKVLPRSVREQVVLSVVPEPGLGMRALLASWPGEGGEPTALVPEPDAEAGAQPAEPQLVAGLEVRSRRAVGTLGNEGVTVVPSDGLLSSVTGLGRELADERRRMEDEGGEG